MVGILIYDGIKRSNDTLTWNRGGWHINTHKFPSGDKPRRGGRFFVEAVREELDSVWEWFLDAEGRSVELVAPAGLDLATAEVVAPTVAQPFEHVGASGVHIEGLNITHTAAQRASALTHTQTYRNYLSTNHRICTCTQLSGG